MKLFIYVICGVLAIGASAVRGSATEAFTAADLVSLKRISDPQVSPDGRRVAFVLRETDLDANRGRTQLWVVDIAGGEPRQLTRGDASASSPRWSSDGRSLFFLTARSGSSQVWQLPLAGGEARQVTDLPVEIGTLKIAPDGGRIAFTATVFPDCPTLACTAERLAVLAADKATGQRYDQLFIRHWDSWEDGQLSTLFTAPIGIDGRADEPVNISGAARGHLPSRPFGGDEEYAFSRDGTRLAFSVRLADREEAWSTNFDLWEAPADGSRAPVNLTAGNPASDTQPVYLANGDLAWLAMTRPGFEADRFHVRLRDGRTGAIRVLTDAWDRSVTRLGASTDSQWLLANTDDIGQMPLFEIDPKSGAVRRVTGEGQVAEYAAAPGGAVVALTSIGAPADLWFAPRSGKPARQLTDVNGELLAARSLGAYEQFSFKGWNDELVYGYVIRPPGLASGRKAPIAFVVHGGPQVSLQNQWSYRWNAQVLAGQGYGVVMIDYHGSPGYGQAFTDSISKDWGGKPLVDLQKGLAAAVERYDWLDGERACALGPSYGGFMMNWIAGNWPDRFRCLVNHAGIFDSRSMYYTTEELWFEEWEHGGPYYLDPSIYEKNNPANFLANWKTPMLVTHGELDYRVPFGQGLAAFTFLQRRGIPSRLLYFRDENHWILKPANSLQWHDAVFDWLATWLK
ncbi:MAG: S9 family peptidase [Gammaproteobacteria bacterium]|nr:S9 family peptidase [Gammaproteobacteria bacterium]